MTPGLYGIRKKSTLFNYIPAFVRCLLHYVPRWYVYWVSTQTLKEWRKQNWFLFSDLFDMLLLVHLLLILSHLQLLVTYSSVRAKTSKLEQSDYGGWQITVFITRHCSVRRRYFPRLQRSPNDPGRFQARVHGSCNSLLSGLCSLRYQKMDPKQDWDTNISIKGLQRQRRKNKVLFPHFNHEL